MSINDKLLNIDDVALMLCLSPSRIRYEVFHRRIPHFKIGRSIRFSEKEIQDWVASQKKGGTIEIR